MAAAAGVLAAYRDRAGRLVGFLGALPRPMTAAGRPVLMAVGHHFMVDPEHRGTLAALQLLRAFLAGPQDLSMCESNSEVRKLWHAVGGTTSHLYSPTWTRPLRPAKYFASLLRQRGRLGAVAAALSPACWLFDRVATANRSSPYYLAPGDWTLDEVNADALVDHIHRLSEPCYLRPHYDAASLTWLLALLRARRSIGSLEVRLVRRPRATCLVTLVCSRAGRTAPPIERGRDDGRRTRVPPSTSRRQATGSRLSRSST
jgi:hypothetical protein